MRFGVFCELQLPKPWADVYYGIIKSDPCVPLGHAVNANVALVSSFSIHHDREEAIRRGHEGFEFFGYAHNALVARNCVPGRSNLWGDCIALRGDRTNETLAQARGTSMVRSSGIGTPDDIRLHLVIFLQQAGRNRHDHVCESLELFAAEVNAGVQGRYCGTRAAQSPGTCAAHRSRAQAQELDGPARRSRHTGRESLRLPGPGFLDPY